LIGKYPVTYRQYRAFADDPDGYHNEKHWKNLVRTSSPGEQYRAASNHVADTVSWYDAFAFCRWLSVKLQREVRLPYDEEWLAAATGKTQTRYPWGNQWDDSRANTSESRLNRATAVGAYPHGASSYGVMDAIGSVWEWCL